MSFVQLYTSLYKILNHLKQQKGGFANRIVYLLFNNMFSCKLASCYGFLMSVCRSKKRKFVQIKSAITYIYIKKKPFNNKLEKKKATIPGAVNQKLRHHIIVVINEDVPLTSMNLKSFLVQQMNNFYSNNWNGCDMRKWF